MYDYIKGTVVELKYNSIVVDNNGVGYLIYVPNPYAFEVGQEYKVYVYQQVKEDEESLFGFKVREEKELFLKLISVKGLGCRMTLPMFAVGSTQGIMDAIERENILYLKKFPKIGEKLARQIVLDLKGKLEFIGTGITDDVVETQEELQEALLALGYKEKEIKKVIEQVDENKIIEEQIKEALKLLLR